MTEKARLVLVDGNNFLYRAYYSTMRAGMTNGKGVPTGATRVFVAMIRKIEKGYPGAEIAVVFDARGPCFRHEIYPAYKATRKPMPDDLRAQEGTVREIVEAMGIPIVVVPGVEADDVLATLAKRAAGRGVTVYIATGDKDLAVMVGDDIFILNTMDDSVLDRAGVREKFGVPPELISDFLALRGDAADNIPGMTGVGDKSAAALLNAFGGIDGIAANLGRVKELNFRGAGTFAEKFLRERDAVELSRRLTAVRTDVPLPVPPEELVRKPADHARLLRIFTECEFAGFAAAEKAALAAGASPAPEREKAPGPGNGGRIEVIANGPGALGMLAAELKATARPVIFHLGERDGPPVGLAVRTARCDFYLPFGHEGLASGTRPSLSDAVAALGGFFADGEKEFVGYDVKTLMHALDAAGGRLPVRYQDVMLKAHCADSAAATDLKTLARLFLDLDAGDDDALTAVRSESGKVTGRIPLAETDPREAAAFAFGRLDAISRLDARLDAILAGMPENRAAYAAQELPLVRVLFAMEKNGFYLDRDEFARQSAFLNRRLEETRASVWRLAGREFNVNSTAEIADVLYGGLGIRCPKKTPTGRPSTSEETLGLLAGDYEIARRILDYRFLAKLIGTYVDKLPRLADPATGRIHGLFHQDGTVTGRLSSSDPNLQNIPVRTPEGRAVRAGFAAEKGYLIVSADYSQIELRLMAHIAGEKNMQRAFREGLDIHRSTAALIHDVPLAEVTPEMRGAAKAINFGLMYGMNRFGLAKQLHIPPAVAALWIDSYFRRYPGVRTYMEETKEKAHRLGYVTTVSGRRLNFAGIRTAPKAAVAGMERAAINAPMQGSAAEIIKLAMIAIHDWISALPEGRIRMLSQVHDELIFEVREEFAEEYAARISAIMSSVMQLDIPLEVSAGIGKNWSEAH